MKGDNFRRFVFLFSVLEYVFHLLSLPSISYSFFALCIMLLILKWNNMMGR